GAPSDVRVKPETARLPAGEALVSWVTPRDEGPAGTLGFLVALDGLALPRELIPLAGEAGAPVEMHVRDCSLAPGASASLSIQAGDAAGNRGPAVHARITVSTRVPAPLPPLTPQPEPPQHPTPWPRVAGAEVAILDELDKIHTLTGELIPPHPDDYLVANHLWDAATRTINIQAARNEFVAFQVLLRGNVAAGSITPELTFDGAAGGTVKVEMGRYHPVPSKRGPLPDPIVPLAYAAGQRSKSRFESLHVEVFVPHGF